MQKRNLRMGRWLWIGCAAIIIGVPFHAFLTAWFASNFGHFDLIRLWKEFIVAILSVTSIVLVVKHPALQRDLRYSRMAQTMLLYIGFIISMAGLGVAAGTVDWHAALYGIVIDTRFVVFLLIILVAGHLAPLPIQRRRWVLIPAAIVIVFGLLQMFILPQDFLRHFGYGPQTLPSYQPVDSKPWLPRVQSTLRGPNPLGAYLVPIILSFSSLALAYKKRRTVCIVAVAAGLVVLYGSYSRSALIGLGISAVLFAYWSIKNRETQKKFMIVTVIGIVLLVCSVFALRHNDTFQNIAFHTNEKSVSASTNSVRFSALSNGVRDIAHHPLGSGVGSAGPASLRNTKGEIRIAENFYLQIGQEAGVVGLILLMTVLGGLMKVLYRKRSDVFVRAALASFVGVLFINLVSHALADDILAYILFALVGFALIRTNTKSENLSKL